METIWGKWKLLEEEDSILALVRVLPTVPTAGTEEIK